MKHRLGQLGRYVQADTSLGGSDHSGGFQLGDHEVSLLGQDVLDHESDPDSEVFIQPLSEAEAILGLVMSITEKGISKTAKMLEGATLAPVT